jgi:hypothetical protein
MAGFDALTVGDRITYTKREFSSIVKNIFENPESLKTYINDKKLSNDQSKIILKVIDTLNSKNCSCCRRFDANKLQLTPIQKELEPLLDIAQINVKTRNY